MVAPYNGDTSSLMRTKSRANSLFQQSCRNINLYLYFSCCFLRYFTRLMTIRGKTLSCLSDRNSNSNRIELKRKRVWKVKCRQGWKPWSHSSYSFCSPLCSLYSPTGSSLVWWDGSQQPTAHPPFTLDVTTQVLGLTPIGSFRPCHCWTVTREKRRQFAYWTKLGAYAHL